MKKSPKMAFLWWLWNPIWWIVLLIILFEVL